MPYIDQTRRDALADPVIVPETVGELNYLVTRLVDSFIVRKGVSYTNINNAMGALECAKLELYRRLAAPYEDEKSRVNGEVYNAIRSIGA